MRKCSDHRKEVIGAQKANGVSDGRKGKEI